MNEEPVNMNFWNAVVKEEIEFSDFDENYQSVFQIAKTEITADGDLEWEEETDQSSANTKKKRKRRIYPVKRRPCPYCTGPLKYYSSLARHLRQMHPDEAEVKKALAKPIKDPERRKIFGEIGGKGDLKHNTNELINKGQNYIVKRRCFSEKAKSNYLICEYCGKMISGDTLWHHVKLLHPETAPTNKTRRVKKEALAKMKKIGDIPLRDIDENRQLDIQIASTETVEETDEDLKRKAETDLKGLEEETDAKEKRKRRIYPAKPKKDLEKETDAKKKRTRRIYPAKPNKDLKKETDAKKKRTRRIYPVKRRPCPYCTGPLKYYSSLARHLRQMHPDEAEVKKALAKPIKDPERRKIFGEIGGKADLKHNTKELINKGQNYILKRRCFAQKTETNYLICQYCGKMISSGTLWHHIKLLHPETAPSNKKKRRVQKEAFAKMEKILDIPLREIDENRQLEFQVVKTETVEETSEDLKREAEANLKNLEEETDAKSKRKRLAKPVKDLEEKTGQSSANTKKKRRRRIYPVKARPCPYCPGPLRYYSSLARHLRQMHTDEAEVKKALAKPINDPERRKMFGEIAGKGDLKHNTKELLNKGQNYIVKRRCFAQKTKTNYLICQYCGKMISSGTLWHHVKLLHPETALSNKKKRRVQKEAFAKMEKILGSESLR